MPTIKTSGRRRKGGRVSIELTFELTIDADAKTCVGEVLDALAKHAHDSLRAGVRPDTGAARPAAADGGTWGVESGTLLAGIKVSPIRGSAQRAEGRVVVPSERQHFAAWAGVLSVEGLAADVIEQAFDDYLDRATKG